jgi:hypothetical protein
MPAIDPSLGSMSFLTGDSPELSSLNTRNTASLLSPAPRSARSFAHHDSDSVLPTIVNGSWVLDELARQMATQDGMNEHIRGRIRRN